jgi:O-antigen/teichoic acid export membrane protein
MQLSIFSAYSLASMLAVQIATIVASPLTVSLLPRFSALFGAGEHHTLASEYHRWTQLLMVLMLPILGVLVAFGDPILKVWLGPHSPLVPASLQFLPVLSIGTMFSIMMIPPYLLQMSVGWSSLLAGFNICAWMLMVACLVFGVPRFGAMAGAYCWLGLNVGYYLVMVALMHRRLLQDEKWRWWWRDTMLPWAVNLFIFVLSARLGSTSDGLVVPLAHAILTAVVSCMVLIALLPAARTEVRRLLQRSPIRQ